MVTGPRLAQVWVLLTIEATFLVPASTPIVLADIWWTIKSGEWMLANGRLLTSDPFTWAPMAPDPVNAQWLAQIGYALMAAAGGLELVIAGNAAIATLAFGLLLRACYVRSGRLRLSCGAVLLAYALAFTNLGERPQTMAYPFFCLFLLVLSHPDQALRWRDRRVPAAWALPPAMAVWANLHGSFGLGLLLVACAALGRLLETRSLQASRRLFGVLAVCLVAACLTPYGPRSLAYLSSIGGNAIIRNYITEWATTSVASPEGVLYFASLGIGVAIALRSTARPSATEWLTLAVFGALGLSSIRAVAWWGFVLAPILVRLAAADPLVIRITASPETTASSWQESLALRGSVAATSCQSARPAERTWLNAGIAAALVLVGVSSLPWLKPINPLLPPSKRALVSEDTPVAVAAFLRGQSLPARMFNYQGWGGYFDWALWPQYQPFVDGRIEIHPDAVWLDYLAITYPAADWQERLSPYTPGFLVLNRMQDQRFISAALNSGAWSTLYEDNQAVVLIPSSASS